MKNNIFTLIILSLLLSACAKEKVTNINPEFSVYVARFEQMGSVVGVNVDVKSVTITFDDSLSGTNTLGVCRYGGDSVVPQITINPQFWKSSSVSNSAREQLMFHELGHCVLNRPHRTEVMKASDANANLPVSIMYPYHLKQVVYEGNYQNYLTELFLQTAPSVIYASNISSFPANAYASTMASTSEDVVYKAVANEMDSEGLTDEDYAGIENFGCGEDHEH